MSSPFSKLVWLLLCVFSLEVSGGKLGMLDYEIGDMQVTITDCDNSAEGKLVIPNEIEGLPVTSIGRGAFAYCKDLTSIIIPDGVTSIGGAVFIACESLKSVTIPLARHSQREANRLSVGHLWPDGFFLPSSANPTAELSIRLPLQLILTGDENAKTVIETTDSVTGPWSEWRTVIIGEEGTTEVDLYEGADKRFYRVREVSGIVE